MKKYKVCFSGFAYVEAEDAEEARFKVEDLDEYIYREVEYAPEEIDEFEVYI